MRNDVSMTRRRPTDRRPTAASSLRRLLPSLAAVLLAVTASVPALGAAGPVMVPSAEDATPTARTLAADTGTAATTTPVDPHLGLAGGSASARVDPAAVLQATIQYEEAVAHAGDKTDFAPGERVTVPFKPRKSDRWAVGGVAPRALPAGRLSGKALRAAKDPTTVTLSKSLPLPAGPIDTPSLGPGRAPSADLTAAVDPGGLRREVFGFLPYWELTDSSTRLDWEKISTIAYFGVGAASNGDLARKNTDGSTTVGWSGWTSSKMTSVINAAHHSGARVVLTVQSFAWTSSGVTRQKALLGSSTNRLNLARQIASAVRDRGADGVNLDFEPIVATYGDEFTALVKTVRAELDKVARGYQVTFDTTGWIGNYPIENATGSAAADAVVVMGYDYKSGSSAKVGSVAPLGGPVYDIGDTIRAYVGRIPPSRVILGVPYYGRAWSTDTSSLGAKNISGTKYGASTTVVYGIAHDYAQDHGRRYDPVEGVAWTVYKRENCTSTYGCVNPWRQIYYDDATALGAKYDLVNRYGLRGVGLWALGYDGTRTELYSMLKTKFIVDTIPPKITSATLSTSLVSPNGDGRLDSVTVRLAVTGLTRYGWLVTSFIDGVAGPAIRSGNLPGQTVSYTWDGRRPDGSGVPDGPYRITLWAEDASRNRSSASKIVTLDTRPPGLTLSATPTSISPNGDGRSDRTSLHLSADSTVSGKARILGPSGSTVRSWDVQAGRSGTWSWSGTTPGGSVVADGRYTFRIEGFDLAGNQTVRDARILVDRTIRSQSWTASSFRPTAGGSSRIVFSLARKATVTVAIYRGTTLVRNVWVRKTLAPGSYRWTWTGRTAAGALVSPGTYSAVITATSWIGASRSTRSVTVAP
jgi:spore germination protein YaaH/flagellar hook assembly protein FlgD